MIMSRLNRQFSHGSSSSLSSEQSVSEHNSRILHMYLHNHPSVLDRIIFKLRRTSELRTLLQRKESEGVPDVELESETTDDETDFNISIREQSEVFLKSTKDPDMVKIFYKAAATLAKVLHVDWFSLYIVRQNNKVLFEYESDGSEKRYGPIGMEMTVSAAAATEGRTLIIDNLPQNSHYPNGVGHPERDIHNVLSVPLLFPSGDLLGVIELCNTGMKDPFNTDDMEITNWLIGWMVTSLHEVKLHNVFVIQSKLNDFLMKTSWELFDGKFNLHNIAEKILLFSQDLVHAGRCSMFVINEDKQLYADYFDACAVTGESPDSVIKFSRDKGIAGWVYKTGELVNVYDAYSDERFNPDIDQQTGYLTKNILCVPLISNSCVIGVVEMINSLSNDHFTYADERALKTFAVYCALALHYSNLNNLLQESENMYAVMYEMLQYHIVASKEDCKKIKEKTPPGMIPISFSRYEFNAYTREEFLPQLFLYMMHDLFGEKAFHFKQLRQFIMTVKNNYRPLPYHNWPNAFQVAHTLYCMLRDNPDMFTTHEKMALMIAGICHHVDHRGYSDSYYKKLKLPLARYYIVTKEHHYTHTCTILQLQGHNILSNLNKEEYDEMLSMLRDLIISTNNTSCFKNRQEMSHMLANKTFDMENQGCRRLLRTIMFEAAHFVAAAMPWSFERVVVARLYEEFYSQGDAEKEQGLCPNEMKDRNYAEFLPDQQVSFIEFTCIPLFSVLGEILPDCYPLVEGALENLEHWNIIIEKRLNERKKEERTEKELSEEELSEEELFE